MDLIECPHCETRVVPMSGGQCPACRRGLEEPPDESPEGLHPHPAWPQRPADAPTVAFSFATIRTFAFHSEAELARVYLEEQGIPAFLANAEIVAMAGSSVMRSVTSSCKSRRSTPSRRSNCSRVRRRPGRSRTPPRG